MKNEILNYMTKRYFTNVLTFTFCVLFNYYNKMCLINFLNKYTTKKLLKES